MSDRLWIDFKNEFVIVSLKILTSRRVVNWFQKWVCYSQKKVLMTSLFVVNWFQKWVCYSLGRFTSLLTIVVNWFQKWVCYSIFKYHRLHQQVVNWFQKWVCYSNTYNCWCFNQLWIDFKNEFVIVVTIYLSHGK